jgi:hypothetical protein
LVVDYAFEGFQLDAQHRVLSRAGGEPIPLAPKVFDTLLCFVEHHGELLDKRVLLEAIWPHVIVEENNLNQSISTLRRVLGERPGEHRFIATGDAVDTLAAAPQSKEYAVRAPNTFDRKWPFAVAASIAVVLVLVVIERYVSTDYAAQDVITNERVETSPGFKDLVRELGIVAHWRTYGWPRYCHPSGGDDFECS